MCDKPPSMPEPFVTAEGVAAFLAITPRRVKDFARSGQFPAYPLGTGQRRVWRFRLSEVAIAMSKQSVRPPVEFNPMATQNRRKKS